MSRAPRNLLAVAVSLAVIAGVWALGWGFLVIAGVE